MIKQILFLTMFCSLPLVHAMNEDLLGNMVDAVVAEHLTRGVAGLEAELFQEVSLGNVPHVQQLLAQGANPNIRNDSGSTPLSIAACDGDDELCGVLLRAGADVHAHDDEQYSALSWAAFGANASTCKLLLKAGARVDHPDREGKTPLMHAAESSRGLETCKVLLQFGANPAIKNNAQKDATDCVKTALDSIADVMRAQGVFPMRNVNRVILEALKEYDAILALLNSPNEMRAVIWQGNMQPIKRLRRDSTNMTDAVMLRELN